MISCKAHFSGPAVADPQAGTPDLVPPYDQKVELLL